jgi:hypothetical protein
MNTFTTNRGYTLLFSVLTAALVLGVAVFIFSIATKQFELSVSVKNSMYSFYAADSGLECASLAFANGQLATTSTATMPCAGQTATSGYTAISSSASDVPPALFGSSYSVVYRAQLNSNFSGGTCANVYVYDGYATNGVHWTVVDSRGYNHCVTATKLPDTTLSSTVERAIRLSKQG